MWFGGFRSELNRYLPTCKVDAFPIKLRTHVLAGMVGFEPTQVDLEDRCPSH